MKTFKLILAHLILSPFYLIYGLAFAILLPAILLYWAVIVVTE